LRFATPRWWASDSLAHQKTRSRFVRRRSRNALRFTVRQASPHWQSGKPQMYEVQHILGCFSKMSLNQRLVGRRLLKGEIFGLFVEGARPGVHSAHAYLIDYANLEIILNTNLTGESHVVG
jgi:hypothetical protein